MEPQLNRGEMAVLERKGESERHCHCATFHAESAWVSNDLVFRQPRFQTTSVVTKLNFTCNCEQRKQHNQTESTTVATCSIAACRVNVSAFRRQHQAIMW